MNSIDKARTDPRLQSLLKNLATQVKIKYVRSEDDGWASNLEGTVATIWWCGCKHPSASLAHELLHIQLQLNGYRRIRVSVSNIASPETSKRLMDCIDNEIQHHKIYPVFISMGFTPEQFYRDSDAEVEQFLRQAVGSGFTSVADASIVFFSLIAPGGRLTDAAKEDIRNQLNAMDGGKYESTLDGILRAISDWTQSQSSDAREYIKQVLLAIHPIKNLTWYGFASSARPPDGDGVFVDLEFSLREQ